MNMDEKLDFIERFDKLSQDAKKTFILFHQASLSDYNYEGLFENTKNEEFGRYIKDILKNQRDFMQYKISEWYLALRNMELQYDPLTNYDDFEKNEKVFNDIIEQMGVWAGNEECLNKQIEKIKKK